jgi:hypothetical protein
MRRMPAVPLHAIESAERTTPRIAIARALTALASRLVPPAKEVRRTEETDLVQALSSLAQLEAEMDRLRRRRPKGWANTVASYALEAERLRTEKALEYRRDDRGDVFLVHDGTALYYVPSAVTIA